jgi:hypothetical protein
MFSPKQTGQKLAILAQNKAISAENNVFFGVGWMMTAFFG